MSGNPTPIYIPSKKDTPRKKFGSWRIRYTGLDSKRYSITRKNKTDVIGAYNAERKAIELGTWAPPQVRKQQARKQRERDELTVKAWVTRWLERQKPRLRESTWQKYQQVITGRITDVPGAPSVATLAQLPIHEVDKQAVYQWWDAMNTAFDTPNTNRKAHIYLRAAFEDAVERDVLKANPVSVKAARVKPTPKKKELPATEDLLAIVDHCPDRYRFVAMLCLFMGLRVGEALALTGRDMTNEGTVEQPRWVVHVRGNLQRLKDSHGHSYMQWQEPKTQAGWRDVPVFEQFNDVVAAHLDTFAPKDPGAYLTQTATGMPVMDTSLRNVIDRARRAAGVTEHITPHYGRNWLITHLAESGATPAEIGHFLGQSDLKTITETYMKVRPDNAAAAMSVVGDLIDRGGVVVSFSDGKKRQERKRQGA